MPIPAQRDPEVTRKALTEWLAGRLPDARDLALSELSAPGGTGFSNETLLFDAGWTEGGERRADSFVVRVEPTGYQVFLEADFERQYRLLEVLDRETDVPVPRMHWYESDPGVLGAPFFVMGRVEGEAPSDNPPYHTAGFLHDAAPDERRRLWEDAMRALAAVHAVPADKVGFLTKPDLGPTGLDQLVAYWGRAFEWGAAGRPQPVAAAAWEWLTAHLPAERPTELSWGDSRIGNMLFADFRVRAVLDWEMLSLGGPLVDLGWWLFFDDTYAIFEGKRGVPRLPGLGGRDDTIAAWEQLTGRRAHDLEWYEIFAGFRYAIVMMRLAQMMASYGTAPPGMEDFETNNNVTHALARLLDMPPPGPLPQWG